MKFDIFNLLNNQKLIEWNTTIRPDPASPLDSLGYRTGYIQRHGVRHGHRADSLPGLASGNTGGRTFRVALGVRF